MQSVREILSIKTEYTEEIVDITPRLNDILDKSEIIDGMMLVFPLHTSSAVYLNDSDRHLVKDSQELLRALVPSTPQGKKSVYHHNQRDPKENAAAHLKSMILGHNVTLPISKGKFDFGLYHTVYYAEFDGRREKEILIKIFGE
jgi:secondary thiamine-phosphate synthase enzyme